jgi:hypothetical protein
METVHKSEKNESNHFFHRIIEEALCITARTQRYPHFKRSIFVLIRPVIRANGWQHNNVYINVFQKYLIVRNKKFGAGNEEQANCNRA